ncbi:MAG: HAD-IC family P-type ATPase [Candidatus Diapherotrites archaeon]|nr:HAD-IC family P-type ATPase [Candidatus Diapherotrites archaeon]
MSVALNPVESPYKQVLRALQTSENGLSPAEAQKRLQEYGPNAIQEKKHYSLAKMLLSEFTSSLVLVLIAAGMISFFVGETLDGLAILGIVVLNGLLGFFQEYKAEKAMEALKKLSALRAIVMRGGETMEVAPTELVPGDIVLLDEGSKAPADLRLIETVDTHIDEALLTGESNPVHKTVEPLSGAHALADQRNMAFSNTTITRGHAKGVVVCTGMKTEFGKIAGTLEQIEEEDTPLKRNLERLAKQMSKGVLALTFVLFIAGIFQGRDVFEMFLIAVSLGVAAIPEGLPAIITISLALGIQQMAKRNAIVRRMPAVETLGSTTVICSDKTGTLTKNEMTVEVLLADNKRFEVSGSGYSTQGNITVNGTPAERMKHPGLERALEVALNCNNAHIQTQNGIPYIIGDPTEGALIVAAKKGGLRTALERVHEIPFSSEKKFMTTVNKEGNQYLVCMKGAVEQVLARSTHAFVNGKMTPLTSTYRAKITVQANELAQNAYRVLALAFKYTPHEKEEEKKLEQGLAFAGLAGMRDPPREEVKESVRVCMQAGIRVKIITGDNALTAKAIAQKIGLQGNVLTGSELDALNPEEFNTAVESTTIFARVNPEHKYRIVSALKRNKNTVVAVTGDGVNDAPALKRADIGIAMGIKGTDVTKEAADVVLKDDNFATIVAAVSEGRKIFSNIKGFIRYMLSANFGEIIYISIMALGFRQIVLLPIQILWINLATDALPALALGTEKANDESMHQKPRRQDESIIRSMLSFIVIGGLLSAMAALTAFYYALPLGFEKARTMAFTVAVFFELALVFSCRQEGKGVLELNPLSNKYLVGAVLVSAVLQLLIVQVPFLQTIFDTVTLNTQDWLVVLGLALTSALVPYLDNAFKKYRPRPLGPYGDGAR